MYGYMNCTDAQELQITNAMGIMLPARIPKIYPRVGWGGGVPTGNSVNSVLLGRWVLGHFFFCNFAT